MKKIIAFSVLSLLFITTNAFAATTIGTDITTAGTTTTHDLTVTGTCTGCVGNWDNTKSILTLNNGATVPPNLGVGSFRWTTFLGLNNTTGGDFNDFFIASQSDGFAGQQYNWGFVAKAGDINPFGGAPAIAGNIYSTGNFWVNYEDTTNADSVDAGFQISNSTLGYDFMVNGAGDWGIGNVASSFNAVPTPITTANLKIDGATGNGIFRGTVTGTGFKLVSVFVSTTTPTISSGFGTSPSVTASNGTATFRVNVGTGGSASTGVVGLPAATAGWNCFVTDITNPDSFVTRQTGSTATTASFKNYSATTGLAIAWTASDILAISCTAF